MHFGDLAACLEALYNEMKANKVPVTVAIFLFSFHYVKELAYMNHGELRGLCKKAGVSESYATEIYKGLKLAPYIELKPNIKTELHALSERVTQ